MSCTVCMVIGLGTSMLHVREEREDDVRPEIITLNGDFALIVEVSDLRSVPTRIFFPYLWY